MNSSFLALLSWVAAFFLLLFAPVNSAAWAETGLLSADQTANSRDSRACWQCHDGSRAIEVSDLSPYSQAKAKRLLVAVSPDRYAQGVHARMSCIDCHTRLTSLQPPHQTCKPEKVDCATCHEYLAQTWESSATTPVSSRLESVFRNIGAYRHSYHVRPNKDYPDFVNATCHDCHDSHFFNLPVDKNSPVYAEWRLKIPELCGKCHEDELESYASSVHGIELQGKGNLKSATCIDCHAPHTIANAQLIPFKLKSSDRCGVCHAHSMKTYRATYHGQVTKLGYSIAAKCFDCHNGHKALSVKNPKSSVHPDNRLKTCQKCHDGEHRPLATSGFASFTPHAHDMDYQHYPQVWIASRLMSVLIWGVLAFFWLHSVLWSYREWRESRSAVIVAGMDLAVHGKKQTRYVRRFSRVWRGLHFLFILVVMTLLLTGITLRHAHTAWTPTVARFLGGVERMGGIHRVAAVLLVGIFLVHLVYLLQRLLRNRRFDWLGPDSLLVTRKDFTDCRDMFKWFLGMGKKPQFDRWTYYEKFDYWAVFWGMVMMGGSGAVLAFPHIAGQYLEGWVFNVAMLLHGEEAVLAALFLFTVHFFNNHFRPNKLPPPDIVMFTGIQSLEEMQRDHPAQLARLLASGELDQQLVDAPSSTMTVGAKLLGVLLLASGLALLVLVVSGLF